MLFYQLTLKLFGETYSMPLSEPVGGCRSYGNILP